MPRIPPTELARLKAETDLPALLRVQCIDLNSHGAAKLLGCCSFQDD
jgi:hypothetical protein